MTIANSKQIALVAILVILASTGLTQELPDLRFTEEAVNFGCVGVDFKIFYNFQLVNYGTDTIHIDTVTPHCDCTSVRFGDSVVAPGDTARFRMIFNTTGFYGPVEKDVRVHSSDKKSPKTYSYYRADIGQWFYRIEPKPVSVFLLPAHKSKAGTLFNHALDRITLTDIFLVDDICEVKVLKGEATKGESIEYEVIPRADLEAGTHVTNFTATIDLHQDLDPLNITIPVKIVRY